IVAAVALTAFILLEMHQRLPLLDLSLFRNGTFAGANLVAILVTLAMFGIFVFFPIYMQTFRGWSPIQAGAALLPWTIMIVIFAPIAGKLSDRVGSRWLMAGGMSVVAVCCLLLSTVTLTSSFWHMLPAFILGGLGMSFVMTPMSAAAMGAVSVDKAGVASGVLNTFRQVGVALGIGIMGAIITNRAASFHGPPPQAFVYGLTFGMKVSAGICLGGAIAAATLVRKYRHGDASHAAEGAAGGGGGPGLSAPERRQAVVETACRVFAKGSYHSSTTAQIARETGVTEPVLYRHFSSKRELYLACLDAVWERVRGVWEKALEREPDPANWIRAIGKAYLEERGAGRVVLVDLSVQPRTVAADDPEIRRALRAQVREVHDYVAGVIRNSQAEGGVIADRDADAEAWIFISLGLLTTIDRRLGNLVGDE